MDWNDTIIVTLQGDRKGKAVIPRTVVKAVSGVTREVKPWDKYKTGTRHNKLGHVICIYFSHEIFDLLTYEPTLTVLHGKDA